MSNPMFWQEATVSAVIAFAATFAGVYFSFAKENSRRREEENRQAAHKEAEEQEQFARLLQSVLMESANTHGILNNINKMASPGTVFASELSTDALEAALSNPLFHRWADHSLVVAASIVRTRLGEMNNILRDYRHAAAVGRAVETGDVARLKIRATKRMEVIEVMQEHLQRAMDEYGAPIVADARAQETQARLAEILREEREQTR